MLSFFRKLNILCQIRQNSMIYNEYLRYLIKCHSQPFDSLIQAILNLAANHHSHHHIQFGVQHQTYAGIALRHLVQLNPERKINGSRCTLIVTA